MLIIVVVIMVIFTESNLKNLFLEKVTKKLFLLIVYKL